MNAIGSIESISKYLKLRPNLIGVGTKTQLVIDGNACNTGVTNACNTGVTIDPYKEIGQNISYC